MLRTSRFRKGCRAQPHWKQRRSDGVSSTAMVDGRKDPDELSRGVLGDEKPPAWTMRSPLKISSYLAALLASAVATTAAYLLFGRDQLPDVVMTYLLGIMLVSSRYGFGPSLVAAFSSVAAFDFVFVPPFRTFAVGDVSHGVTFAVMFLVAIVISGLTQRVRNQARAARHREAQTRALYELSRGLAGAQDRMRVIEVAAGHLENVFESRV